MTDISEDYKGPLPEGWTGGEALQKWWRGVIVHLYTLRKPCAQCRQEMRIDVTKAAIEGKAKNAGLHLKRCAVCRAADRASGTSSRPKVNGEDLALFEPTPTQETIIATMKEELEGLYAQNRELRERLAKYERVLEEPTVAEQPLEPPEVKQSMLMPWEKLTFA